MAELETTALGKTGLTVTRLGAGGHFTNGPTAHEDIPRRVKELHHHLDRGITYFDVQWDPEEEATAEVMKTRADEMTIAWPLHGVTKLGGDLTAQYVIDYCHDHQARYGIKHVDILLWIALELEEATEQRQLAALREGFSGLKAEGFCDYLGFSCHHSPEMALHAIERFDDFAVMMVPYSAMHPAAGRELLPVAKERGVGTVGMKPFGGGGGFLNQVWAGQVDHSAVVDFERSGRAYQAAIKWGLQDPNLDCTVPGMHSIQEIDEIVAAAMQPMADDDEEILKAMRAAQVDSGVEVQLGDRWDQVLVRGR